MNTPYSFKRAALGGTCALAMALSAGTADAQQVNPDATLVLGTTDQPNSYDPAGSYDLPSWTVIYNTYSFLMTLPPGETTPVPDAAKSCGWSGETTYKCTLRRDIQFTNGDQLTAADVKFSFNRVIEMDKPSGPSSLLSPIQSISTPDKWTVVFDLKSHTATWPYILATGAGAIVPKGVYPADELQPSDEVVGSGHYEVAAYKPNVQTVLERNEDYYGDRAARNQRAIVQYFSNSSALKLAVQQGNIDIAYRKLTPTDVKSLREADDDDLSIVEGQGTAIRYLVFNTKLEPGDSKAVRQAAAYMMDREAVAQNVYNSTVEPLYSMVPAGLKGHIDAFKAEYGTGTKADKAKQLLEDAGIETPVELQLWYTPSHYGDSSADEYAEIERAFETDGVFDVTLKSTEWARYVSAATTDQYPAFQMGWFPDYPDADNYIAPFYGSETMWLNNHYKNQRVDELIAQQRASEDPQARIEMFKEIQRITAKDVPIIPVFQAKQIAVVNDRIKGISKTLDPSYVFRYWVLGKTQ
jgi:peptide/nickel transport system substrate-binding protein